MFHICTFGTGKKFWYGSWDWLLAVTLESEGATNPFLIYSTFLSLSFSICEVGTREGQQHHSLGMKLPPQMSL